MASDIIKKKIINSVARKLYAKIREEKTREILETGKKWILLAPSGVPIARVTTESAIRTFQYVREMEPSALDSSKARDLILKETYTGREFLRKYE